MVNQLMIFFSDELQNRFSGKPIKLIFGTNGQRPPGGILPKAIDNQINCCIYSMKLLNR